MAVFNKPEDMYAKQSSDAKKEADRYWKLAKEGETYYFPKAREAYERSKELADKAKEAHDNGWTWKNRNPDIPAKFSNQYDKKKSK